MTSVQPLSPAPIADDLVWEIAGEDCVELTGQERKNFLNSYVTQDIKNLGAHRVAAAAFLTQKGKLVSEARVWNFPEQVWILFPPGFGAKVEAHLATFLLFANVTWKDRSGDFVHFTGTGPRAAAAARAWLGIENPEPAQIHPVKLGAAEAWFAALTVFGREGWELLAPREAAAAIRERISAWEREGILAAATPEAVEEARIEAGVPKMAVDMDEDNLVAEVGLDLNATSFNKGCYLGQETTARVQSRGHVNRKLARVRLAQDYSGPLPAELFQGDKKVGRLTSALRSARLGATIGLATVQLSAWESGEAIYFQTPEGKIGIEKR